MMAKHNCAICGAEVGLISEQKLADNMMLENFETKQETEAYRMGSDSMPERK